MIRFATTAFIISLLPMIVSAQNLTPGVPVPGNYSSFVSDVSIPDGTVVKAGQRFTKTWKLKNTGTTTWSGYHLVFTDGDQMGAPYAVPVPETPPGDTVEISVPMTAPHDAGAHRGIWQMRTASEAHFGVSVLVLIRVEASSYQGRTFEDWVVDLQSQSSDVRIQAIQALSRFGPRAAPELIRIFRSDANSRERGMAVASLAIINPQTSETMAAILDAAIDAESSVKMMVEMSMQGPFLQAVGQQTVPALVDALRDTNSMKRHLAIQFLAHLGPAAKEAIPTLQELAADDPDPMFRKLAEAALLLIGQPRGTVSDNRFTSARGWFSVEVPKSSNWAGVPFIMQDVSINRHNVGDFDAVSFSVNDFGEVLFASVRRIPESMLTEMRNQDQRAVLSRLAYKALDDWRDLPVKPKVIEESYLKTSHGETLLRVFFAEKGSLLLRSSEGMPVASDTFDTLIAVIVAKGKNHYVYAIAENDAESSRADDNKAVLMHRAKSFFESLVVKIKEN